MTEEKNYNSICIIMLGLFGDVLMRTPILKTLKLKYPKSVITVIVDPIGKELLENNPNVNKILIMNRDKKNKIKYLYSKVSIQIQIIKNRYDLILDLYNGKSSKTMIAASFCKSYLGFYNKKVYTNIKNTFKPIYSFKNYHHLTNRLFFYLNYLELDSSQFDVMPEYFFKNENISKKNDFKENRYLISLGSGGLEKILDLNKIYNLIKYLYDKYSLSPIIVNNPGQEFLQDNIINDYLIPNNITYIKLEKKSIEEIAIIIQNSKFFIVPDTGLFHLSLALRTPTFCIFTYTNPLLVEPNNIIYGSFFKPVVPTEYDKFGLEIGTKEINMNEVFQKLDSFLKKII